MKLLGNLVIFLLTLAIRVAFIAPALVATGVVKDSRLDGIYIAISIALACEVRSGLGEAEKCE